MQAELTAEYKLTSGRVLHPGEQGKIMAIESKGSKKIYMIAFNSMRNWTACPEKIIRIISGEYNLNIPPPIDTGR